jgi:hypothetical protein
MYSDLTTSSVAVAGQANVARSKIILILQDLLWLGQVWLKMARARSHILVTRHFYCHLDLLNRIN